jgi:quercetin dioxygenase-like cupin family protein
MKIFKTSVIKSEVASKSIFIGGQVRMQTLLSPETSKSFKSAIVNFAPAARTKFHAHTGDQILIVTHGKGIVATDKEKTTVGVGDIVFFPAGEKHKHGATKDSSFSHIHIQIRTSETSILE